MLADVDTTTFSLEKNRWDTKAEEDPPSKDSARSPGPSNVLSSLLEREGRCVDIGLHG